MKKIILTLALVMTLGFTVSAQRDAFFNDWDDLGNGLDRTEFDMPALPYHGLDTNQNAPLGSGLVILAAMGAGYALARRKSEK